MEHQNVNKEDTKTAEKNGIFRWKKWSVITFMVIVFAIFAYIQNNHIVVTTIQYQNEKIPDAWKGYRIVQISDLHTKSFGKGNRKLLTRMEELKPDLIVLTGDLVDSRSKHYEGVIQFVKDAASIAPVYYVTGNHEYQIADAKREALIEGITKAGGKCLSNETVELTKNGATIKLSGLEENCLFDMTLDKMELDPEELNILLAHEPQWIKRYVAGKADLVFTGHAHGGQFILPFFGPVYAPGQGLRPKYATGVHVQGATTMVVSRGLGNSVIPLRLFNYPEIVCVEFD